MSEVRINLPIFEGPLDLLLYLIRRDELDIWDIPIARITDEYLRYLDTLQELDLDVAGDFVVMAASLTQIKSRMLLPTLLQSEDGEEEDPRQRLVEKLLEYERYRQAAQQLAGATLLGRDVFNRQQSAVDPQRFRQPLPEVELWDLVAALRDALDRARLRGHVHHVDVERFSVVDRIHWLHDRLETGGDLSFRALFDSLSGRMAIVLTFLALLEMIKRGIATLGASGEADWIIALRPTIEEDDDEDEDPGPPPAEEERPEGEGPAAGP